MCGWLSAAEDLRFPLESLKPLRIGGKHVRTELQRDVAPEFWVPRPLDVAHADGADGGEDLVRAEASAGVTSTEALWIIRAGGGAAGFWAGGQASQRRRRESPHMGRARRDPGDGVASGRPCRIRSSGSSSASPSQGAWLKRPCPRTFDVQHEGLAI
jgi:hypothetical protein